MIAWRSTLATARSFVRTYATKTKSSSSRSPIDRLRSGIAFERQRGYQNYPGQTMLFSDFLVSELRQIVDDEVDPLLASAHEYGRWPSDRRRAFLTTVEARLDASDAQDGYNQRNTYHHDGQRNVQSTGLYYPFVIDTETTVCVYGSCSPARLHAL